MKRLQLLNVLGDASSPCMDCNFILEPLSSLEEIAAAHRVGRGGGAAPLYSVERNGVDSSGNVVGLSERDSVVCSSLGVSDKNFEEVCEMVSLNENIEFDCEMVPYSNNKMSWEVSVDLANGNLEVVDRGQDRNEEQSSLFPELQDHLFRKKFISLAEMQDKYLSAKEKRRRGIEL
ncbi:hypothetical protein V6N13_047651 [Hibiscus sabdariffa]|uniref:Uncharacterized protein n=1 Tax=Hibiscus sabdariffa TaxID=183260 RepID=A0ABR2F4T9_9ROSI